MENTQNTIDLSPHSKSPADAFIAAFNNELTEDLKGSFTEAQLHAVKKIFDKKEWAIHPLDVRTSVGLWRWRFYFVLIGGRDKRTLSARRYKFLQATVVTFVLFYLLTSTLLGVLALYLLKSALGYNLISGFSFGVWAWFKGLACGS